MGWVTFVTLDANFIYTRLIHMFFANIIINEDISNIINFVKEKMIILSDHYLSNWLISRPRVFSGTKLITVMPSLTKEV